VKFWDASAIIPLLVDEPDSPGMQKMLRADEAIVVWWGTPVECASAIARLHRDGALDAANEQAATSLLETLAEVWIEVLPTPKVRTTACRLLRVHPLRAADALQLAAAFVWASGDPRSHHLVTRDARLADAARKEGFVTE
jgi:predicted nucleic acid-binding protein